MYQSALTKIAYGQKLAFSVQKLNFSNSPASLAKRQVAVVLSGCGVYDGSEIHEASAILVHLTRGGVTPVLYAQDVQQMHVINHTVGEPSEHDKRNVLVESARIARGNIESLSMLKASDHDALVFPGGFGVAKNLSNFATDGPNMKVVPEVERIIKDFHSSKKPIALCCIAPILAAKVIKNCAVTLGQETNKKGHWPYHGATEAAKSWGAKHVPCEVDGCHVDEGNRVITTPAFMYETKNFHEIYDGVGKMIKALLKMVNK